MKKAFLFAALAAVTALTAVSCDREPAEPAIKPHDPNDVGGVYGVNYEVFIDDDTNNDIEDGVSRFQAAGVPLASVEVGEEGPYLKLVFNPYHDYLRFCKREGGEALEIWPIEMEEDGEGNYRFGTSGTFGGGIQSKVTIRGIPDVVALVGFGVSGTIVRRSEKRGWVSTPGNITPDEETTDMYYDLDMTIDAGPYMPLPDDKFKRMVIKIYSH